MRLTVLALLVLLLALRASGVQGQDAIHQCVASNGTPVFSDQPCTSVNATAVTGHAADASATTPTFAPVSCPATVQDLKERINQAFAAHDANGLAGLMLWHGYGRAEARTDLRYLRALVHEPLMGIGDGSPPDPQPGTNSTVDIGAPSVARDDGTSNKAVSASAIPKNLTLHLGGVGDDAEHNPGFAVVSAAGCVWLSNAPD